MPAVITLKALGLNTSPNQLEVAEGSLSIASNVVIKRDNIVEPRRGFKLYGDSMPSSTDRAKQLLVYKRRILRHYATTLQYDNGSGTFTDFAGSYSEQEPGYRIRSLEQNGNFYFTTSNGIMKISSATSDFSPDADYITPSGGVKALDGDGTVDVVLGETSGFMPLDSAVAYRFVWGTKDANNNLILGVPSSRVEVYNPMLPILLQDYVRILGALDAINQGASLITDGDYVDTLKLTADAAATTFRTNLLDLTTKLDQDILIANDTGTGAPLNISAVSITGGVCTITFSAGTPTDFWTSGSKVFLSNFIVTGSGSIDGAQTLASAGATTITFNTAATGTVTFSAAIIESGEYRAITQPTVPTTPPIHLDLVELSDYLTAILDRLQAEPNAIIPTALRTTYIDPIEMTTTVNVLLTVNIPDNVTPNHFLQVYRSETVVASDQQILTIDVAPSDELRLVYEAYPTAAELLAGQMIVEDVAPDSFRGANLYINPVTGEGILQANDIPPFAIDINTFKNHAFYANTRTKQRYNSTLLGVQNMLEDYNNGDIPSIVIGNANGSNIYRFIVGEVEESTVVCNAGATLAASGAASYFTINAANNSPAYYVWYEIGTATDPAIADKVGIRVVADALDTDQEIAEKTRDAISLHNANFSVISATATVTITNLSEGYTEDLTAGTSGFIVAVTNQGTGERVAREEYNITAVADVAGSLAGKYFTLNTAEDRIQYYVWYRVSGVGVDPAIANKLGLIVDIVNGDSATNVATKTATALSTKGFIATSNVAVINAASETYGPATDATVGTSGFTVSKVQDGALEVLLSSAVSPSQAVDLTARSLVNVINKNLDEQIYAYYLSGADDTPGQILYESKDLNTDEFYILGNNSVTGASFSPDISPTLDITSISTGNANTMLITTSAPHGLVNLQTVMIAGTDSQPNIDGYYAITYVSPTTFRINRTVTVAGTEGSILPTRFAEVSSNEEKVNRVYFSKLNQPEAVPILNYFDVGASNKAILRIFPLRDSLFVFKEDGLYRISGETSPFNLALFDSTFTLIAPDSIAATNNAIYGWASEGMSSVTESGASVVSRPIDDQILKIGSVEYTNFKTATWGVGYDSDNAYYAFTTKNTDDVRATICYRYSTLTNAWTTFDKTDTCGVINDADDKLYLGAGDTNYIEQERKSFTRLDYADREISKDITTAGFQGANIQLSSVIDLAIGDVFVQEQTVTIYKYNMLLKKLDIDPGVSDSDYYSTLAMVGGDNIRTKLVLLAQKLDADPGVNETDFEATISSQAGTITGASVANPTVITTSAPHGLVDGRIVFITGSNTSPSIDGNHEVTVLSSTTFSIDVSVTSPGTTGTFNTVNENVDDIKACYNAIIDKLNADTQVAFANYSISNTTTIQESVIIGISKATKTITLNSNLEYLAGPVTVFQAFQSEIVYAPNSMGDQLGLKHIREATLMFASQAFTRATMSFATDLLPQFEAVDFEGNGNGAFGTSNPFGENFFGGVSHAVPFRTYIPRNCQRCRFMVVKFSHRVAREQYFLYGITLTGQVGQSSRAYR